MSEQSRNRDDCLSDATVIVTGAGSGIGRAAAIEFGRRGSSVLVTDIDETLGRETLDEIWRAGSRATFLRVDVAVPSELEGAVARVIEDWGTLDVMVNNAGIPMAIRLENLSEDEWERVIDVNLKGMAFGCKFAIQQMLKQGHGTIVNNASVMGLVAGLPNQPAYVASKGGAVLLTKALALDYARDGIRVNCVCPCITDTPMLRKFLETQYDSDEQRLAAEQNLARIQPIGRMCSPEEVAEAIVFLASDLASGITGVALPVDGGFVAR